MHVLIVYYHAFVFVVLKATLSEEFKNIEVTTTDHGDTALTILAKNTIDLAIVDLFMPGGAGGFNFIEMLCESYPKLPLIVLSASENPAHIRKCLDFGVAGFVTKSAPKDALFEAIAKALVGERYIPASLIDSMPEVARVIDEVDSGADLEIIAGLVTQRQMDILLRITQGRSNKQIARELDLSENTVKVHVSAMLRALGLSNRTQAGILGQKLGLSETSASLK
ncbi:MAG: response regulator transcription factor [Porticoccaceae bacterium]